MTKLYVLVLCTGNSCRSQMAEGFIRHYGGEQVKVYSAGLEPTGVNPRAIQVMREVGVDISKHTSNHLSEFVGQSFNFVITVCDNAAANCPIFPGAATTLHWSFEDPAAATGSEEQVLAVFRSTRDEIGTKVRNWLETEGVMARQGSKQECSAPTSLCGSHP